MYIHILHTEALVGPCVYCSLILIKWLRAGQGRLKIAWLYEKVNWRKHFGPQLLN
jgi:hypothetical protein